MAAPNLVLLTSLKIQTAILNATNTVTDIIAAAGTGHAFNVEAVFCSNVHASLTAWVSVILKQGGVEYKITNQMNVPNKTTLNALIGKPIYLAEGDSLRIQANASSFVVCFAPYSDAS